jgi:hypothetical protein
VATDLKKVEAIANWPPLENVKHLRSFLGLAGYYRKFVQHFGIICKLLIELLKKGSLFIWTDKHQQAFATLKHASVTAPVLALPDFTKQFQLETDASDLGVGAVLMEQGHPPDIHQQGFGDKTKRLINV